MNNYEYSVQSSLLQHGMTRDELNSIEHVADVRELENLLNDSLAKQRVIQNLRHDLYFFGHCSINSV